MIKNVIEDALKKQNTPPEFGIFNAATQARVQRMFAYACANADGLSDLMPENWTLSSVNEKGKNHLVVTRGADRILEFREVNLGRNESGIQAVHAIPGMTQDQVIAFVDKLGDVVDQHYDLGTTPQTPNTDQIFDELR